ncbi:TetR/AcrR family transcriptional regulator [Leptospira harrisiae]|uniref:TetR family transcriptional regulator n=1 Tax=Leptospira harrisiae TaxID=2023189 RepID=A0A2N0AFE1_9LEPT|nr:TetR/AcrR family transcriptional regulator [Leptospira harrisiae]PJZ83017.1 TetR family transcriptional regulator [Leptospira harrisiae]PKA06529.1 TetR family transcriptional regulator [Leptospira harrisiae]
MKQKIIKAALKICEKEGYESFSMRKLATNLGFDPMAIYYYFENKEALTHAMVEHIFSRFQKEMILAYKPSKRNLQKILQEYWILFLDYPGMSLYLIKYSYNNFNSVVEFNKSLQFLIQQVYPTAKTEMVLNILIDFIHGNALAFSFIPKGKKKIESIRSNQKEFQSSLSYLLNSI